MGRKESNQTKETKYESGFIHIFSKNFGCGQKILSATVFSDDYSIFATSTCTHTVQPPVLKTDYRFHAGKCIRRFGGIYAYCRYLKDRKW